MSDIGLFGIFWCSMVVIITVTNLGWAINDLKVGSARLSWYGSRVDRYKEPFEFWLAVGMKFLGVPVGMFMLWFGLHDVFLAGR